MTEEDRAYEFELRGAWSGALIDEISSLCSNRKFSATRNGVETLEFEIDLDAFEERMSAIGEDAYAVLTPYTADIIVKKNKVPLFGVHIYDRTFTLTSEKRTIGIKADGFLNLFKDRYITKTYSPQSMTDIAWDLIDTTQDDTNGDFGVTLGPNQYETVNRERDYDDKNIKDALVQQTDILGSEFDFEFTWDKKFNTYEAIGSEKPEVILTYPEIITDVTVPDTAGGLFNRIRALGSGTGVEKLSSIANDTTSQTNYKLREKPVLYNDITVQDTLDEHAERDLSQSKEIMKLPAIRIPGSSFDLTSNWIGDRVRITIKGIPSLNVDGMYRIEKISASLDDNDEEDITLEVDNYGL